MRWTAEDRLDPSDASVAPSAVIRLAQSCSRLQYVEANGIQSPIPIMIRFSVSETKPSGTLLSPPTQAHFNSRFST